MKKMTQRERDLDEVVRFYDPCPKKKTGVKSLPTGVKEVLRGINGKRASLREALEKIKESVKHFPCFSIALVSKKQENGGFVFLQIKDSMERVHSYKLIKFKPIKEGG